MDILSKQEVKDAIEGKASPRRVPVLLKLWSNPGFYKGEDARRARDVIKRYPDDITVLNLGNSMYAKKRNDNSAIDQDILLENFEDVDKFIAESMHNPKKLIYRESLGDKIVPARRKRYKLLVQWYFLFENLWNIRGMANALLDFYDYPDELHKLFRAITDYYKQIIATAKKERDIDGFFVSDDLGTQNDVFFSTDIFKEFFYPYYKEIVDHCHSLGVHFWLHSCGNITKFVPMLIEIGIDVLHPIQRYAMDEAETYEKFKDRICFWYGLDVQKTIPFGTADDVEKEIKRVYSIFSKSRGQFMFTCGNGLTADCPIDSFVRLYEISHTFNPY